MVLETLKKGLHRLLPRSPPPGPAASLELAVAQLLLEIARADLDTSAGEWQALRQHLGAAFALDERALDDLVARASEEVETAVSLHETVQLINRRADAGQKQALVRALWQVAYADRRLDPHEEALLRRLAELLHVPHAAFIREKLQAQAGG